MKTELSSAVSLINHPIKSAGQQAACPPVIYLAALREQRRARFAFPAVTPRVGTHGGSALLRARRALELAAWQATGGDVLRSDISK